MQFGMKLNLPANQLTYVFSHYLFIVSCSNLFVNIDLSTHYYISYILYYLSLPQYVEIPVSALVFLLFSPSDLHFYKHKNTVSSFSFSSTSLPLDCLWVCFPRSVVQIVAILSFLCLVHIASCQAVSSLCLLSPALPCHLSQISDSKPGKHTVGLHGQIRGKYMRIRQTAKTSGLNWLPCCCSNVSLSWFFSVLFLSHISPPHLLSHTNNITHTPLCSLFFI